MAAIDQNDARSNKGREKKASNSQFKAKRILNGNLRIFANMKREEVLGYGTGDV